MTPRRFLACLIMPKNLYEAARWVHERTDVPLRRRLCAAALVVSLSGLLSAAAPLALKALVDTVAAPVDGHGQIAVSGIWVPALIYLLAVLSSRLLTDVRPTLSGMAEQRLASQLILRSYEHFLALPLRFHNQQHSGTLAQTLQQGVLGCRVILAATLTTFIPIAVELTTVVVILIKLGLPALTLAFLFSAMSYTLVGWRFTPSLKRRAHAASAAGLAVSERLADGLINVEPIKSNALEGMILRNVRRALEDSERCWLLLTQRRASFGIWLSLLFVVSLGGLIFSVASAAAQGSISIGGFVLVTVYMLQVLHPLDMLSAAVRDIFQAWEFVQPLAAILKKAPEEPLASSCASDDPALPPSPPQHRKQACPPRIRFRQVTFGYEPSRTILHGLNLDVRAGQCLAIVGASGSGKSTIARLLLRLYCPQAGEILVDDLSINAMGVKEVRSRVGVVPQDTILFRDTIAANIGAGSPGSSIKTIVQAAKIAQLHDMIEALPLGYETIVGERGTLLSGGERQRVAIARAVIKRPDLFIFDEATSMLDTRTEASILQDIQKVSAGHTSIVIAHRLTSVVHAEEIVVLDAGRVAERGSHSVLLRKNGAYAALWHAQERPTQDAQCD